MARRLFGNNLTTTLSSGIAADALSLPCGSGISSFPTPGLDEYLVVVIEDSAGNVEIVKCDGKTGSSLTVDSTGDRGFDGTTAQAFSAGARVEVRLTASAFDDVNETFPQSVAQTDVVQTITASYTFQAKTYMDASLVMDNNVSINAEETGGAERSILGINTSNRAYVGNLALPLYFNGTSFVFTDGVAFEITRDELAQLDGIGTTSTIQEQIDSKALVNGDNTERFDVAAPNADDQAIRRDTWAGETTGGTIMARFDGGILYLSNTGTPP